jgi:malonate-semialdehyde dehydrogenase (acetylating) / methylmalonate-semialdehyde dehydrogenase
MARIEDIFALVNSHAYGNGVSTRDGHAAREFGRSINVGMVGTNVPIAVPMAWQGFGGWRSSFFGDTHAFADGAEFGMPVSR